MLIPAIHGVSAEGLLILPEVEAERVVLKLQGSCDSLALPILDRFLEQVHGELVRTSRKRVEVDCDRLYFMNSASVKCFMVWLRKIGSLPKSSHYGVHFIVNPRLTWQRRSFGTIRRSVPDLVTLSDAGQSA